MKEFKVEPWGMDSGKSKKQMKDFVVEPWMAEFAKGKHSMEEWDGFLEYCEAGPWKRLVMAFCTVFFAR